MSDVPVGVNLSPTPIVADGNTYVQEVIIDVTATELVCLSGKTFPIDEEAAEYALANRYQLLGPCWVSV
jgi:hypothetical protein